MNLSTQFQRLVSATAVVFPMIASSPVNACTIVPRNLDNDHTTIEGWYSPCTDATWVLASREDVTRAQVSNILEQGLYPDYLTLGDTWTVPSVSPVSGMSEVQILYQGLFGGNLALTPPGMFTSSQYWVGEDTVYDITTNENIRTNLNLDYTAGSLVFHPGIIGSTIMPAGPVPEPGTFGMAALGGLTVLGAVAARRRREYAPQV